MKDLRGKEIKLGDKVVTTQSNGHIGLEIAEVVGFTPQKVKVGSLINYKLRETSQIVVLVRNPDREEALKAEQKPAKEKDLKL